MEGEKRYISLIVVGVAVFITAYFGFLWWQKEEEKKLQEIAYLSFLVAKNLKEGNYDEGLKIIEEIKSEYGKEAMAIFARSYYLLLDNVEGKDKEAEELSKLFKDKDIKSLFLERMAYEKADITALENINERVFNYESSLFLKAVLLKRENKEEDAKKILSDLASKDIPYFSSVAQYLKER